MKKQPQAFTWVTEGRYKDGWQPLPDCPTSDISRRHGLANGLAWAARNLFGGWRTPTGRLRRRDIRVSKYVRAGK